MEDMFRVGQIASTHGLKGEVKVYPTTDDVKRFENLKKIFLDLGDEKKELHISGVKYFKNMVILKFKEFDNINEVEKYRKKDLYVLREDAIPLEEGEYYIADLIGLHVFTDEGVEFGVIKDVLQTGANDVYVVNSIEHGEVLLPVIKQCVLNVDLESEMVTVHIMEGLI